MPWMNTVVATQQWWMHALLLFVLVLSRVSGLMALAPVFGSQDVPLRVRGFLAVFLALVISPLKWQATFAAPRSLLDLALLLAEEACIGLMLGAGILILFAGIQVAGQVIGQMSGMALADVFNPALDSNLPLFSHLLFYLTLALFVITNGHLQVLAALLDMYEVLPLAGGVLFASFGQIVSTLTHVLSESFVLGIRASAPVMVALLLATLVMGLISRTLPSLNIMAFGFGLSTIVTLVSLSLSLGGVAWVFQDALPEVLNALNGGVR